MSIENPDALEKYTDAVDRVGLASSALKASVKVWQAGGPGQAQAWEAVESQRKVLLNAVGDEKLKFGIVTKPPDQQSMDLKAGAAAKGGAAKTGNGGARAVSH